MGEFGVIDGQRNIPMDTDSLKEMLSGGREKFESEVREQVEPPPDPTALGEGEKKEAPVVSAEEKPFKEGEGPDDETRKLMLLPSEAEKVRLKERYGELKVVPMPYRRADGKYQCYILCILTRAKWRAMETAAEKVASVKPDRTFQEIKEEKIVASAVVWPPIAEHEMHLLPGGLVSTLYGISEQMACFFNPEAIMQFAFAL